MRRRFYAYAALACLAVACTTRPAGANPLATRPQLAPGTTFLWHSLEDSTETFIGYLNDPECPLAPCSRWLGTYWAGNAYFFEDGDLNIYRRETLDGERIATPYIKRMHFPAADGSTWQSRFRNAAGWEIEQTVTVVGWEQTRTRSGEPRVLHLHADNHRLNGSPYLGSAAWFAEDYFVSELPSPTN